MSPIPREFRRGSITMPYTQRHRLIAIATPLGNDELLLGSFSGVEAISQPFSFHLDLLRESATPIAFDDLVGEPAVIAIQLRDASPRYWHGIISRFFNTGYDGRFMHYQAELVPWLALLSRSATCRIFQGKTVPQIIQAVFTDHGFSASKDFKIAFPDNFDPLEYCVQYRETDLNFVARLMEQNGIFYYFEHSADQHTMVLVNSKDALPECAGQSSARLAQASGGLQNEDIVTDWRIGKELRSGAYSASDYNFETPSSRLLATSRNGTGQSNAFEIYDYPGEYGTRKQGEQFAKLRIEHEQSHSTIASGTSNCRAFASGTRFKLSSNRSDLSQEYILAEIEHSASVAGTYSDDSAPEHYVNHVRCVPADAPFRPARLTPKPIVQGPQTAVVVGRDGEEIWTDKYGRIRVHFHWDREASKETSSCWMRVAQPWTGKRWGAVSIPRVGQEVIVEFLEGDPDRPLVTGCVYNAEQVPPYDLPANKTRTSFKTSSSKGGDGFNELRFEDAKGQEQIFVHAERQLDFRTKADRLEAVGGESHLTVEKDSFDKVGGDRHSTVKGDSNEKIEGTASLTTGQDLQVHIGSNCAFDAGTEIHLNAGMNVVIESGTTLTLKCGGNFVNLNPAGVFISGTMVMINSGGSPGSGAGCHAQSPNPPKNADDAKPGGAPEPVNIAGSYSPAALVLKQAAFSGAPFCDI